MRRKLMVGCVLAAALIGCTGGAVMAGHGPGGGFGGPPPGMERGGADFEGRMAKILKLTDTQRSQIKAIREAERAQVKPLLDRLHDNRKLLMQASEAATFDEAAVRMLAGEQAKIEAELIVSRAKTHNRVNALLTADQRELAKSLRPDTDQQPPPSP